MDSCDRVDIDHSFYYENISDFICSPLHLAIEKGIHFNDGKILEDEENIKQIDYLLNYNDVNLRDTYKWTLLHSASRTGKADIVSFLIQKGAGVNDVIPDYGWTPLHIAARYGNTSCMLILLLYGADIIAKDKYGNIPLHIAADKNNEECVIMLLDAGSIKDQPNNFGVTPSGMASSLKIKELIDSYSLDIKEPDCL